MVKSLFHLYFRSSHHLYFIFLSRVKINSINWPAPNIWVFIAQLVEHCSANAEAMGSNPVEALKFFSGLNLQLLKLRLQLRWSNLYFINIRILGIELELACNRGSCGAILSHANIFNDIPPHELRLQASSSSIPRIRILSIITLKRTNLESKCHPTENNPGSSK